MDLNKFDSLNNHKFNLIFIEKSFKQSLFLKQIYQIFKNLFLDFNYFEIMQSLIEVIDKHLHNYFNKGLECKANRLIFILLYPILHYMLLYHSLYQYVPLQ
jgi:hypothetical protein